LNYPSYYDIVIVNHCIWDILFWSW